MRESKTSKERRSFHKNRIRLPFDKAVEGLLAVKPKKRPVKRKPRKPDSQLADSNNHSPD